MATARIFHACVDYVTTNVIAQAKHLAEQHIPVKTLWILSAVASEATKIAAQEDVNRNYLIWESIQKIAAGPDGKKGTPDDILPTEVIDVLRSICSSPAPLVQEVIQVTLDAIDKDREEGQDTSSKRLCYVGTVCSIVVILILLHAYGYDASPFRQWQAHPEL